MLYICVCARTTAKLLFEQKLQIHNGSSFKLEILNPWAIISQLCGLLIQAATLNAKVEVEEMAQHAQQRAVVGEGAIGCHAQADKRAATLQMRVLRHQFSPFSYIQNFQPAKGSKVDSFST